MKYLFQFQIRIYAAMLFMSYLLFSYYVLGGWWNSSVGTLLILGFSFLIKKNKFPEFTGIKLSPKNLIISLCLAAFLVFLFHYILKSIAKQNNAGLIFTNWKNYYHDFFYTLNEEIVLGAIAINICFNKFKLKPITISLVLALLFSIIHYIFYRWIFLEKGILLIPTLLTLFFIGILRNNLIIITKHIGFSWALHFSWMAIMFGSYHFYRSTNIALTEYQRFNLYLGSKPLIFTTLILALLSSLYLLRKRIIPYNFKIE
jgi:hypothetical protein